MDHSLIHLVQIIYNKWRKLIIIIDSPQVDYKAISRSAAFESYCELTVQLQHIQLQELNHEEKLAFFINIYNALVIHGNLHLGSPKTIWQRYRVRSQAEKAVHCRFLYTGIQTLVKEGKMAIIRAKIILVIIRVYYVVWQSVSTENAHKEQRVDEAERGRFY